jgi:hypothetical protein
MIHQDLTTTVGGTPTESTPARDETWQNERPPLARCLMATVVWISLIWLSRGLLSHLFGFVPMLAMWGTVGIYALVQVVRVMFWTRSRWIRLAAALVLPVVAAVQIRACAGADAPI